MGGQKFGLVDILWKSEFIVRTVDIIQLTEWSEIDENLSMSTFDSFHFEGEVIHITCIYIYTQKM